MCGSGQIGDNIWTSSILPAAIKSFETKKTMKNEDIMKI